MTTRAAKAPKEKLTLSDTFDLLGWVSEWVEQNVDALELNGGVLPDDVEAVFDEIVVAQRDKVDAIVAVLEDFAGRSFSAKAMKDRGARREKVWNNTIAALKASVLRQLNRRGIDRVEGYVHTLRQQANGGLPSVECSIEPGELLAAADYDPLDEDPKDFKAWPLVRYMTVERVAKLDRKRIAEDYAGRRMELEEDAVRNVGEAQISDEQWALIAQFTGEADGATEAQGVAGAIELLRAKYVADRLSAEFPGITVFRGSHLRID